MLYPLPDARTEERYSELRVEVDLLTHTRLILLSSLFDNNESAMLAFITEVAADVMARGLPEDWSGETLEGSVLQKSKPRLRVVQ